ncbi:MAG: hypothetical protein ACRD4Y_08300, partial [Candidatus Acidiferrales bacterium]
LEVFNGYCGAESGSVPVAAVAPAILISEMEVQKKETSTDKPPILPPPAHDPMGARQCTAPGEVLRSDSIPWSPARLQSRRHSP